jgi:hypothetical protein
MVKRSCLVAAALFALYVAPPVATARADIIKIQNPGSPCSAGTCTAGGVPFSLTDIENGTQTLTDSGSASPTYIVKDDISGTITSISIALTGTIASNQFLTIQFGGGISGTATLSPNDVNCTTCGGNDGHADFFDPSPGGNGSTQVPVTDVFTWSGISLTNGTVFEIQFSSFANGANVHTVGVPGPIEGAGIPGLIAGLGALGLLGWRRKRKAAIATA